MEKPQFSSLLKMAATKGYETPAAQEAFANGWICGLEGGSPGFQDAACFRDGWMAYYAVACKAIFTAWRREGDKLVPSRETPDGF